MTPSPSRPRDARQQPARPAAVSVEEATRRHPVKVRATFVRLPRPAGRIAAA